MTDELKVLMDRATTRELPFVPDPAVLLGVAHRRARRRRAIGVCATLALLIAVGGSVHVAHPMLLQPTDPAAKSTTRAEDRYAVCVYSQGRRVRDPGARNWPLVASASDQYGASELRRAEGTASIVFCQRAPRQVAVPGPSQRGLFVSVVETLDQRQQILTVAGQAAFASTKIEVTTAANQVSSPEIRNGWFVHRHAEPAGTPLRMDIRYYRDDAVVQALQVK